MPNDASEPAFAELLAEAQKDVILEAAVLKEMTWRGRERALLGSLFRSLQQLEALVSQANAAREQEAGDGDH